MAHKTVNDIIAQLDRSTWFDKAEAIRLIEYSLASFNGPTWSELNNFDAQSRADELVPTPVAERALSLAFDATAEIDSLISMLKNVAAHVHDQIDGSIGTDLKVLAKSLRRANSVAMSIVTRDDCDFNDLYFQIHDEQPSEADHA